MKPMKNLLKQKQNEKRYRTIQKYQTLLEHLKNFEKVKRYKLSFDKINLEFYERFHYLLNERIATFK